MVRASGRRVAEDTGVPLSEAVLRQALFVIRGWEAGGPGGRVHEEHLPCGDVPWPIVEKAKEHATVMAAERRGREVE